MSNFFLILKKLVFLWIGMAILLLLGAISLIFGVL